MDPANALGSAMNKRLGALLLFSLLFFLLWYALKKTALQELCYTDIDSKAYLANAELLYKNGSFSWPPPHEHERPYYVLGYSALIATLYTFFGPTVIPILIFQLFLVLLSIFLIIEMTALFSPRSAPIAGFLAATHLGFLTYSFFILTEITVVFFLTLFLFLCMRGIKCHSSLSFLLSAFALSLSVLIKPAALYFPFILIPFLAIFYYTEVKNKKQIFMMLFSWLMIFCLPLASYAVHQYIVFSEAYICKLDQENILYWFYPHLRAAVYKTTADQERLFLRTKEKEWVARECLKQMREYPFWTLAIWLKNCAKSWLGLFTTQLKLLINPALPRERLSFFSQKGSLYQKILAYIQEGSSSSWVGIVGFLEAFLLVTRFFFLLLAYVWLLQKKEYWAAFFILLYVGYFTFITGHDGCARFRMLIEPLLILLQAIGITAIYEKFFGHVNDNQERCA